MAEEATLTDGGSSPTETETESPQFNQPIFIDDPVPEEEPGVVESKEKPADETDHDRFDQNPKFQERLKEMQAAKEKADGIVSNFEKLMSESTSKYQQQIDALTQKIESLSKKPEEPDFWDVMKVDHNTFMDRWDQDPRSVIGNMGRQLRSELIPLIPNKDDLVSSLTNAVVEKLTGMSNEMATRKTVTDFVGKHDDFKDMMPEIKKYMNENPGHNELSAYLMLKESSREEEVNKLVEAKLKERDAQALKGGAREVKKPISSANRPAPAKSGIIPDEVINPQKHGTTSDKAILKMLHGMRKGGRKE